MKILYTDKEIVVAVKPYGVLSEDGGEGSMPALLAPYVGKVFPVHRLDRVVGGVMVYARTKSAAATLSRAVSERKLKKEYIAVLEGAPSAPCGELRDLLFKDARQNKSFVVDTPRRGAREAVLTYRTLDTVQVEGKTLTRVSVLLDTGRSHQIRVQFASRGTPLVGAANTARASKRGHLRSLRRGLPFRTLKQEKCFPFARPHQPIFRGHCSLCKSMRSSISILSPCPTGHCLMRSLRVEKCQSRRRIYSPLREKRTACVACARMGALPFMKRASAV